MMKRILFKTGVYVLGILFPIYLYVTGQYILFWLVMVFVVALLTAMIYDILHWKESDFLKYVDHLSLERFLLEVGIPIVGEEMSKYLDGGNVPIEECLDSRDVPLEEFLDGGNVPLVDSMEPLEEGMGKVGNILVISRFTNIADQDILAHGELLGDTAKMMLVTNNYYTGRIPFDRVVDRKIIKQFRKAIPWKRGKI